LSRFSLFNAPSTTAISTLSLHDALPIFLERYPDCELVVVGDGPQRKHFERLARSLGDRVRFAGQVHRERPDFYASSDIFLCPTRSEEHTSELQSLTNIVCRLLLEKKKNT